MDIRNFFGAKGANTESKVPKDEVDLTKEEDEKDTVPRDAEEVHMQEDVKEDPPVKSPVKSNAGKKQGGKSPKPASSKKKAPAVQSYFSPFHEEAIAAVALAEQSLPDDEEELKMTLMSGDTYSGKPPDEPKNRDAKGQPPRGHPDALSGKTFVISGVMDSMLRSEMEEYVKMHGGRVTSQVSGKTSYLIVGEHTGKSKYSKAKEMNLKMIDEDGLWSLVSASIPFKEALEKSRKDTVTVAEPAHNKKVEEGTPKLQVNEMLWVDKWKPKSSSELIGNNALVENLKTWLSQWESVHLHGQQPSGLKKSRGKDLDHKKAVLLSGSPGIGKTSAALIIARECGYEPVEVNASDTRSKSDSDILKGIGGKLSNAVREMSTNASICFQQANKKKLCLIMDEVDGMSAGDRGGVPDLINTIAKSKVPIIAICNDKWSMKLKSLRNHCLELDFRKPTAVQIQKRISMICRAEGLNMNDATLNAVIQNANGGDIRLILGQLQMIRRRTNQLSYDEVSKSNSKDIEMSPFEASRRLLDVDPSGPLSFSDQLALVFQDHDLVPLLVQENYLNHRPQMATNDVNRLAVIAKAADEFSGGDLVSTSVRKYQNWSLLPFACALGVVSPSSYARGSREVFSQYETNFPRFTAWLGQNSSFNRKKRLLGELHTNMISSGHFCTNRTSLRLDYCSTLKVFLIQPLLQTGKEGVPDTLSRMSDYALSREDLDSMIELTTFKSKSPWAENVYSKVPTAVKTAFTRAFNKQQLKDKRGFSKSAPAKKRKAEAAFEDEDDGLGQEEEEEEEEKAITVGDLKTKLSKSVNLIEKEKGSKKGAKKSKKK